MFLSRNARELQHHFLQCKNFLELNMAMTIQRKRWGQGVIEFQNRTIRLCAGSIFQRQEALAPDKHAAGVTAWVPPQKCSKMLLFWSLFGGVLCSSVEFLFPFSWALFSITGNFSLQPFEPELPTCTTNSRLIHCAEDKPTHLSSGLTAHAAAHCYSKTFIWMQKHLHLLLQFNAFGLEISRCCLRMPIC